MPLINLSVTQLRRDIKNQSISSLQFSHDFIKEYAETKNPNAYLDLIDGLMDDPSTKNFISSALDRAIIPSFINNFANVQPERCINLFLSSIPKNSFDPEGNQKKISDFLTSNDKFAPFIKEYLVLLRIDEQAVMFKLLLESSVKKYNASVLNLLKQIDTNAFNEFVNGLPAKKQTQVEQLTTIKDESTRSKFTELMSQFTNGYGKITYEGALLTRAQISARKVNNKADYEFNATVLKSDEKSQEFREYLTTLKNLNKPLQEVFIISDVHWYAGVVNIDEKGNAKIFLIDSLGKSSKYFPDNLIKTFANVFLEMLYEIYFSYEKRQHAALGCSAYAMDDAVHLFTVEKYLGKKYNLTGLFGYLADHIDTVTLNTEISDINIVSAKLPLSFLRTKQSSTLLTELFPSRKKSGDDLTAQFNKPKANANKPFESIVESMQVDFIDNVNRRIETKLQKMADYNAEYLLKNIDNMDVVTKDMHNASLAGFQERVSQPKHTLSIGR